MNRNLLALLFVSPITLRAHAFDKLLCQSQMQEWIVTLTSDNKTAILTPYRQSVTLTARQSETLIIKDVDNKTVATVFPWNGLYVRNSKNLYEKYSISSSESNIGFEVEVYEKPTKVKRRLSCRFTF